jgi:hypothetical protein
VETLQSWTAGLESKFGTAQAREGENFTDSRKGIETYFTKPFPILVIVANG